MHHTTDRLPGLDLLRSIAIVWVMLFHSFLVGGLGPDWEWLSRFGWMGVDLFFVLSGFLIGTQVLQPLARGERLSFADFYLRRAFRILPAYWAVLALYLAWPGFREAPGMEPAWKFLAFLTNLSIDYARNAAFSHAWSLCVEEHFYWLFPPLAVLLMRRPAAWKFAALCGLVVVGGIALRAGIWLHNTALDPDFQRNWFIEELYYPTWNRLDGLLCGVALAVWKCFRPQHWAHARRHANAAMLAGLCLVALSCWLFRDRVGLLGNSIGWPVLSLGLGLLVFAGAGRDSLIGRWQVPGAGWLAAISYSLYLVHKAVYHVVQTQWGAQLEGRGLIAFAAYGTAALAAGAALHYAVELPGLRLRDRLPMLTRTAAAPATP
ncbi:acyltransferase family protein [Niveibacterium sp.]|uniref:acyltransferase family protein n=1 Tax=Niveibacterium sp. TaxID=2017444 RepID=UPI0035B14267